MINALQVHGCAMKTWYNLYISPVVHVNMLNVRIFMFLFFLVFIDIHIHKYAVLTCSVAFTFIFFPPSLFFHFLCIFICINCTREYIGFDVCHWSGNDWFSSCWKEETWGTCFRSWFGTLMCNGLCISYTLASACVFDDWMRSN